MIFFFESLLYNVYMNLSFITTNLNPCWFEVLNDVIANHHASIELLVKYHEQVTACYKLGANLEHLSKIFKYFSNRRWTFLYVIEFVFTSKYELFKIGFPATIFRVNAFIAWWIQLKYFFSYRSCAGKVVWNMKWWL